MTTTPHSDPYSDRAVAARHEERRATREANLRALDMDAYIPRGEVPVGDLRVGWIADRIVYHPVFNTPEFHSDIVTAIEPSRVIVGGFQITWSDGRTGGHTPSEAFLRAYEPIEDAPVVLVEAPSGVAP